MSVKEDGLRLRRNASGGECRKRLRNGREIVWGPHLSGHHDGSHDHDHDHDHGRDHREGACVREESDFVGID